VTLRAPVSLGGQRAERLSLGFAAQDMLPPRRVLPLVLLYAVISQPGPRKRDGEYGHDRREQRDRHAVTDCVASR
jgi:hypothetical protein